jgi:hypothetical protein
MQAVFFARHGWRVTGMQAVFFARHGWRVTGVDFVERALDMASERAAAAGAEVEWIHGDVTHLDELGLAPGYELIYDVGCFHALSDDERSNCAISLAGLASPSALLLLMGFAPGRRGPAPRGISRQQVASLFEPEWRLLDVSIDDEAPLPLFLRNARPTWYHMVKD